MAHASSRSRALAVLVLLVTCSAAAAEVRTETLTLIPLEEFDRIVVRGSPSFICPHDLGGFDLEAGGRFDVVVGYKVRSSDPGSDPGLVLTVVVGFDTAAQVVFTALGSGLAVLPLVPPGKADAATSAVVGAGRFDLEVAGTKVGALKLGLTFRENTLTSYRASQEKLREARAEFQALRLDLQELALDSQDPEDIALIQDLSDALHKDMERTETTLLVDLYELRTELEVLDEGLVAVVASAGSDWSVDTISIADVRVKGGRKNDDAVVYFDPLKGTGDSASPFPFSLALGIQSRIGSVVEEVPVTVGGTVSPVTLPAFKETENQYSTEFAVLVDESVTGEKAGGNRLLAVPGVKEFPNDPKTTKVPPMPGTQFELRVRLATAVCLTLRATVPGFVTVERDKKKPGVVTYREANHAVLRGLDRQFLVYHPKAKLIALDDGENDSNLDGANDVGDQRDASLLFADLGVEFPRVSCPFPPRFATLEQLFPGNNRLRVVKTIKDVPAAREVGKPEEMAGLFLCYTKDARVLVSPYEGMLAGHWEEPPTTTPPSSGAAPAPAPALELPFVILGQKALPVEGFTGDPLPKPAAPPKPRALKDGLVLTWKMGTKDLEVSTWFHKMGLWPTGTIRPLSIFTAVRRDDRVLGTLEAAINADSKEGVAADRDYAVVSLDRPRPLPTQQIPDFLSSTYSRDWLGFQAYDPLKRAIINKTPIEATWHHFLTETLAGEALLERVKSGGEGDETGTSELAPVTLLVVERGFRKHHDFDPQKFAPKSMHRGALPGPDKTGAWERAGGKTPPGAWEFQSVHTIDSSKGDWDFHERLRGDNEEQKDHGRNVLLMCAASGKSHHALRGTSHRLQIQLFSLQGEHTGSALGAAAFHIAYGKHGPDKAPVTSGPLVVNYSLGYRSGPGGPPQWTQAFTLASYRGVIKDIDNDGKIERAIHTFDRLRVFKLLQGPIFVCAAGHDGQDVETVGMVPARICPGGRESRLNLLERQVESLVAKPDAEIPNSTTCPLAITVGGTEISRDGLYLGKRENVPQGKGGSNHGPRVRIGAPWGPFDLARDPGVDGTSVAAPQVSAALATLWQVNATFRHGKVQPLNWIEVIEAIEVTGERVFLAEQEPKVKFMFYGRMNFWSALLVVLNGRASLGDITAGRQELEAIWKAKHQAVHGRVWHGIRIWTQHRNATVHLLSATDAARAEVGKPLPGDLFKQSALLSRDRHPWETGKPGDPLSRILRAGYAAPLQAPDRDKIRGRYPDVMRAAIPVGANAALGPEVGHPVPEKQYEFVDYHVRFSVPRKLLDEHKDGLLAVLSSDGVVRFLWPVGANLEAAKQEIGFLFDITTFDRRGR